MTLAQLNNLLDGTNLIAEIRSDKEEDLKELFINLIYHLTPEEMEKRDDDKKIVFTPIMRIHGSYSSSPLKLVEQAHKSIVIAGARKLIESYAKNLGVKIGDEKENDDDKQKADTGAKMKVSKKS